MNHLINAYPCYRNRTQKTMILTLLSDTQNTRKIARILNVPNYQLSQAKKLRGFCLLQIKGEEIVFSIDTVMNYDQKIVY